jgi:undecaprenyl-diphosphatase
MAETPSRLPSLPVAVAAAALAVVWFEMLTVGTGNLDDDLLRAAYAGGHPAWIAIAQGLTFLGSAWVEIAVGAAGVALLAWLDRKRAAIAGAFVIFIGRLLVEAQKYAVARVRPIDEVHLVPVSTPSFPSGHASNSMIVCLTLAILFFGHTRWRWLAVTLAMLLTLCIGFSRLMLGVHWPSDVIGGWSFGLLWVVVALPWAERLLKQR